MKKPKSKDNKKAIKDKENKDKKLRSFFPGFTALAAGYSELLITGKKPERVLNLAIAHNIDVIYAQGYNDSIKIAVTLSDSARIIELCKAENMLGAVISENKHGLRPFFLKYKRRIGLFAGIIFLIFSLYLSTLFIWCVKIEGNVSLTEEQLRDMIRKSGICEGGLARSVDPDAFRLTLITEHPEIAFAAVTISGTTAYIQIAERTPPPAKRDISLPINLVASRSGIIRKTIVIRGTAAVKAGQYVKEGELLVSGITALKNSAFRIVRAEGKIYGETCHAPEFTVPTQADVKVFTGREMTVSSLDILGSQIPLYLNGTCSFEDYDVMRFRDEAFLFDIIELPFGIMNRVFLEYEIKREWISPQRAQDIAYDLLAAYIKNKLTGAEIISKETEITCSDTDGSVTLRASINCIEDIAVEKEFTIGQ